MSPCPVARGNPSARDRRWGQSCSTSTPETPSGTEQTIVYLQYDNVSSVLFQNFPHRFRPPVRGVLWRRRRVREPKSVVSGYGFQPGPELELRTKKDGTHFRCAPHTPRGNLDLHCVACRQECGSQQETPMHPGRYWVDGRGSAVFWAFSEPLPKTTRQFAHRGLRRRQR